MNVNVLLNKSWFQIVVVCLICTVAYSNSFKVPFHFDDFINITANPLIKDRSNFNHIPFYKHSIDSTLHQGFNTRFIGYLSFAINYWLHKNDVFGYHFVNFAIHLITSISVYYLIAFILKSHYFTVFATDTSKLRFLPFLVSLIFAVHPIQTQAVTYIVQRFASLATMFYVITVLLYASFRHYVGVNYDTLPSNPKRPLAILSYGIAVITCILAMKTKEIAFTLPIMLIFYELLFCSGTLSKRLFYLMPFLLCIFIIPFSMLNISLSFDELISSIDKTSRIGDSFTRQEYFLTQLNVLVTYLQLMLPPFTQNLDYDYPISKSITDPSTLLSAFILTSILSLAIVLIYKSKPFEHSAVNWQFSRLIAWGIIWFFVSHIVESSIFPIEDVIYEHRMYLPSVGIILAYTVAMILLLQTLSKPFIKKSLTVLLIVIISILPVATYQRNEVWQDDLTLWFDVVQKSPLKARPRINLGNAYRDRGNYIAALNEYEMAEALDKNGKLLPITYNNIGILLTDNHEYELAKQYFEKAIELNQKYLNAYYNIALIYIVNQNKAQTINYIQKISNIDPSIAAKLLPLLNKTNK